MKRCIQLSFFRSSRGNLKFRFIRMRGSVDLDKEFKREILNSHIKRTKKRSWMLPQQVVLSLERFNKPFISLCLYQLFKLWCLFFGNMGKIFHALFLVSCFNKNSLQMLEIPVEYYNNSLITKNYYFKLEQCVQITKSLFIINPVSPLSQCLLVYIHPSFLTSFSATL